MDQISDDINGVDASLIEIASVHMPPDTAYVLFDAEHEEIRFVDNDRNIIGSVPY